DASVFLCRRRFGICNVRRRVKANTGAEGVTLFCACFVHKRVCEFSRRTQFRLTERWFDGFPDVFVFCHSLLQLAQLLVSGYMKSSISTIERRYGLSSQKSGILAAFNEVGNTVLIIFVSFFGSRVHRPRYIGGGALLACLASLLMAMPHFLSGKYTYTDQISCKTLCSA
ncbi:hypothetical protein GOODEAATRI_017429, partial [Goodea atripinnis]